MKYEIHSNIAVYFRIYESIIKIITLSDFVIMI